MGRRPWYAEAFGEQYLRSHQYFRSPEQTRLEVARIMQLLNPRRGANVLDLCCGDGRHAIELAQHGYAVTGFDLSEVLLQRAMVDAERAGVAVRWVQGDMRELPFEAEFDAAINVFTSFGYLESEEEDQRVLQQICKSLKPDGLFLQEIALLSSFVRAYQPVRAARFPEEVLLVSEREFDILTSRLHDLMTLLYPDGRRTSSEYHIRFYSPPEVLRMLRVAGLEVERTTAGLLDTELRLDSTYLVTVSRKI